MVVWCEGRGKGRIKHKIKEGETMKILIIIIMLLCILRIGCSHIPLEESKNISDSAYCKECRQDCRIPLFNNFTFNTKNMCCFPNDCPQAKDNPEVCTCIYMVECLKANQ